MIGYVTIGTTDMEKSKAFWLAALESLGAKLLMDIGRIAFIGESMEKPILAPCLPYDEKDQSPGNGNMIALACKSTEQVDALYAKVIELGAADEGAPGERMPGFYGAYFRDLDGNKAVFFKMG